MIHVVWEFRVKPERRREFETHYGIDGTWVAFFRGGEGYRESILLRDREAPDRYVTIDVWTDWESFRTFRERHARGYEEIDRRCEALTDQERSLGIFEIV
jgi:heme-degrading monooxygenase HmoA